MAHIFEPNRKIPVADYGGIDHRDAGPTEIQVVSLETLLRCQHLWNTSRLLAGQRETLVRPPMKVAPRHDISLLMDLAPGDR